MEAFGSDYLPVIRPTLPDISIVMETVRESYEQGLVTLGSLVHAFEQEACAFTGSRFAVAVSSCTSGLILAFAALEFPDGAEVVVPSFTFAATVQALLWNRLTPVYVDCLPGTMTIDPDEVVKAIGPETAAIYPVNIYGLPPDMDRLTDIASKYGIPLIFDSAQGVGSTYDGRPTGTFGLCEVFSLSPTKVITAIEGGLVTTNDARLADKVRGMRDYGKGPDGTEIIYNGLSARMSEFHACVGLLGLRNAQHLIDARLSLIRRYRECAAGLPGCRVQEFPADRTTSGNYFTLMIGKDAAADREAVYSKLDQLNIKSKRYFFPPVHSQGEFHKRTHRVVGELPVTWSAARESLALPLFAHMTEAQQDRVCEVLIDILA